MAKRFIDTELFNDSWYMNLTPELKLFFVYLITNCDNAGIIDLNIRLAEFQTGIKELSNSFETVSKEFGAKRLVHLQENYYFLPNFVRYQYPNGLGSGVKAQQSVILKLQNFNIDLNSLETVNKQLGVSCQTPQDKDMYKDKYKDKDIRGYGGNFEELEIFESTELHFLILEYFGFTEIRNPDKLQQIATFLNILKTDQKIEMFYEQFEAYKTYKEKSNTAKHAFPNFLGHIENRYMDGGWNQENWTDKLSKLNHKPEITSGETLAEYNRRVRENLKLQEHV